MRYVSSSSLKSAVYGLALFATTIGASAANLLVNGSFDSATVPGNTAVGPGSTSISGWIVGGPSGSNVHFNPGVVDLTGLTWSATGAWIEQTFATSPGKTYLVSITAVNGSNVFSMVGPYFAPGFSVVASGNPTQNMTIAPGTRGQVTYQFLATSASTTLRLTDITPTDTNASWIEDVAVNLVVDTTAPVITSPVAITQEATGPNGAVVTYSVSATDELVGPVAVSATPASGSTFAIGSTPVQLSATDAYGNVATGQFPVKVVDTTAPVLSQPANLTVEATSSAGATVNFPLPAATDIASAVTVTSVPSSGATFSLGQNTVTVKANDTYNNSTSKTFTITVRDTTAPALTVPADIIAEATSSAGATVTFTATATDNVGATVTTTPASGSTFALGTTTVTATATDAAGNTTTKSFTVTVRDTTAPVLTVPANLTAEATGATGAVVTFAAPTATDLAGAVTLTVNATSGGTFAIGTTTITAKATDAAGNSTTKTFTITVRDTTAPAPTASLVNISKGGDDESSQFFRVVFAATDKVGVTALTATLNGVTVTNGQIVQLQQIKSGAQSTKRDDGRLQIKATAFLLTVTATDLAANKGTATATAVFIKKGKDDDDKKGDDKKDDDKKDDDKDDDRKKS